jgi:7-carboxy-7-deazaguanine synthase
VTAEIALKVSELFVSLQGEGPSVGTPCLFVRLATCNLHCTWCDTRYTWDWERYRYDDEVEVVSPAELAERVVASNQRRAVITGGEPLLQQAGLAQLFARLPDSLVIEIETNGTIAPRPELADRVAQFNVSPKLSNGGDPEALRIRRRVLEGLRDTGKAWLKLVVQNPGDADEADALVTSLDWPREQVLLMPEAQDRDQLRERSPLVAQLCNERGFRFSSRLHLELWGGERGR